MPDSTDWDDPHPRIRWIDDRLPALSRVGRLGTSFDVILLSAGIFKPKLRDNVGLREVLRHLLLGGHSVVR